MGWTGIDKNMTYAEEKQEVLNHLVWDNSKVLALSKKNNVWYAAVEITGEADAWVSKNGKYVIAGVVLVQRYKGETMFKVMDETMGPTESYAPKKILKLLSDLVPEKSRYAQDWRERCLKNANVTKLKVGDRIKLANPVSFNGIEHDEFLVTTYRTRRQERICYQTTNGILVRLDRHHLNGANVITKVS